MNLPAFLKHPASSIGTRWAYAHDAPTLSLIDSYNPHPWDARDIRVALCQKGVIGVVAELHGTVGFALYRESPDAIKLLRVAVSPSYRRRGVGRTLLDRVAVGLNTCRTMAITVVRESDLDTHLFLRACGWRATAILQGHFEDTGEDGYWFSMRPEGGA